MKNVSEEEQENQMLFAQCWVRQLESCGRVKTLSYQIRHMAEGRLQSLKRKLKRDENFHKKYRDYMDNLVSKGYARKLSAEKVNRRSGKTWYLPRHGVFHSQKRDKIHFVLMRLLCTTGCRLTTSYTRVLTFPTVNWVFY